MQFDVRQALACRVRATNLKFVGHLMFEGSHSHRGFSPVVAAGFWIRRTVSTASIYLAPQGVECIMSAVNPGRLETVRVSRDALRLSAALLWTPAPVRSVP